MAEARDVDLAEWLNAAGFHPADTELKQVGHEAARKIIAELGVLLWQLLPPSREKSIIFTKLESVRHYANQALAVHKGPADRVTLEDVRSMLDSLIVQMPSDPRIEVYKAEQRGESAGPEGGPLADLPFPVPGVVHEQAGQGLPSPAKRAEQHPLSQS